MLVNIYTDGASRGNPGHSAAAYVVAYATDDASERVHCAVEYLGSYKSNVYAEWMGVYNAIKYLYHSRNKARQRMEVALFSDSLLVVQQINGLYKINNDFYVGIKREIIEYGKEFRAISYQHCPRNSHKYNKLADKLCNVCLDGVCAAEIKNGN